MTITAELEKVRPACTEAELIEKMRPACMEAVDSLEIAAVLETEGVTDALATVRYGASDVFHLAERLHRDIPANPAPSTPAPGPPRMRLVTCLFRGVIFALPGLCYATVSDHIVGRAAIIMMVTSLMLSWSFAHGLAYLGYIRKGNLDEPGARWVLRQGLFWGCIVVGIPTIAFALLLGLSPATAVIAVAQVAYLVAATVILTCGRECLLALALTPGVVGAGLWLLHSASWTLALAASAGTVLATIIVALHITRDGRAKRLTRAEFFAAVPHGLFGLLLAGLLLFPSVIWAWGGSSDNQIRRALVLTLPLTLSMGSAEWIMFRYRVVTHGALQRTYSLRVFGRYASSAAGIVVGGYMAILAVGLLMTAWLWSLPWTSLAGVQIADLWQVGGLLPWTSLAGYLALGGAIFVALLLIASGVRVPVLVICAVALAAECAAVAWHISPLDAQLVSCTAVLVVLFAWAQVVLYRATRHYG